ncbi:aminoglycoside 3'-phosphotransferase [Acuticoccus sp. M5D2P5]|uniref:aminoglycoside 3'-phosphotransferase n=1 Tax=Acuticoccus kalidii TaxID=2910977 RepID=UPI001F1FC766|nr:aminoglycoside 3'-phosphotransferase [Acuticoccus kalidii]MCF3933239.1 aminoglycoside 3'-phosphotransferase [Acuticoccus kalidii]
MSCFDRTGWVPVRTGESGDAVYRSGDGAAAYAKIAAPGRERDLQCERDRLLWLEGRGIPCPHVLEWHEDEACLVTAAVPGIPASDLPAEGLFAAWPSMVEMLAALHRLDPRACRFERRLEAMLTRARDVVARDAVNPDFLSDADRLLPPASLLARLEGAVPSLQALEVRDRVVCHGDATMANLMVDPETLRCTGFIDLGRLGVVDPYVDIALMLASAGETWTSDAQADAAFGALFRGLGIDHPDSDRAAFYLQLDPLTWG